MECRQFCLSAFYSHLWLHAPHPGQRLALKPAELSEGKEIRRCLFLAKPWTWHCRSSWPSGEDVGPESERSGVRSPTWSWVKTLGKFLILHCLCVPSSNGYLVERWKKIVEWHQLQKMRCILPRNMRLCWSVFHYQGWEGAKSIMWCTAI